VIRRGNTFEDPEEWEGQEVVISLIIPGMGLRMEQVTIVSLTSAFLLCRDSQGRNQVYTTSHVLGWEPFDAKSRRDLELQHQDDVEKGRVDTPPPPPEEAGIRKVHKIRR